MNVVMVLEMAPNQKISQPERDNEDEEEDEVDDDDDKEEDDEEKEGMGFGGIRERSRMCFIFS